MQPARVGVCQSSSDSAEAQTETKLHNVTNGAQKSERGRVRVHVRACVPGGGEREWRNRQRRSEREKEWKKSREGQRERESNRTLGYPPRANQFRERRARACARAHERVRECVQRSVSSRRAWNGRERRAVSAPHPEIPFETNPSHRDELSPPLFLSVSQALSLD